MSRFSLLRKDDPKPEALPACARCKEPGGECEVWGHMLCPVCWGAWMKDPRFCAGEVGLELTYEEICAAYTKATAEWVRGGDA